MSSSRIVEALEDFYVQKDVYRDTQLRLDRGVENIEECIIQLSKLTQELYVRVRRLEDLMIMDNDF